MSRPSAIARVASIALAVLGMLCIAKPALADDAVGFELPLPERRARAPAVVRGTYQDVASPGDPSGWGYARFTVTNVGTQARSVTFSVGEETAGTARIERQIEAGASAIVFLPRLPTDGGMAVRVDVDGAGRWETSSWSGSSRGAGHRLNVIAIDDRERAKPAVESGVTTAEAARQRRGGGGRPGRTCECVRVGADSLPDRWPLLSFADAIVVEGSRPGLDAERQRILVRAVAAGGKLLVLARDKLSPGPLADLVRSTAAGADGAAGAKGALEGSLGLGRWWSLEETYRITSASGLDLTEPVAKAIGEIVDAMARHPRSANAMAPAGGIPGRQFTDELEIPGLGRLPVRGFFFTILGFVLVAGPLSYFLLRRRKRLGTFLVLLPALGIAFSAAILLYGLLSEGTGIRGAVRSISVLDQRTHEAATRSGRSLYAAFSPSGLRLDPQTLLVSDDFERTNYGFRSGASTQASLHLDLTEGIGAAGGALPSRIPMTYDVTTVGPARERLRFRLLHDGRYEARYGADFAPVPGPRTIVLRDPSGRWHVGGREGPLTPLADGDALDATRSLLRTVVDLPLAKREEWGEDGIFGSRRFSYSYSSYSHSSSSRTPTPETEAGWFQGFLPTELPRGSYLALLERAPAFDDLGLDVAWKSSVHLVHGLLSVEDFGE